MAVVNAIVAVCKAIINVSPSPRPAPTQPTLTPPRRPSSPSSWPSPTCSRAAKPAGGRRPTPATCSAARRLHGGRRKGGGSPRRRRGSGGREGSVCMATASTTFEYTAVIPSCDSGFCEHRCDSAGIGNNECDSGVMSIFRGICPLSPPVSTLEHPLRMNLGGLKCESTSNATQVPGYHYTAESKRSVPAGARARNSHRCRTRSSLSPATPLKRHSRHKKLKRARPKV